MHRRKLHGTSGRGRPADGPLRQGFTDRAMSRPSVIVEDVGGGMAHVAVREKLPRALAMCIGRMLNEGGAYGSD